jgi:hypothetical protein
LSLLSAARLIVIETGTAFFTWASHRSQVLLAALGRRRLVALAILRGMAGVIDCLGPNVLRFKRVRSSARFQLNSNDRIPDVDGVAVGQDALANSGLISVDEGSVLAGQIADSARSDAG